MALDLRGGSSILGLMGHIQQQGELGRQQGNARGLASLLSKGMTANPMDQRAMLAKGMAIDPVGTQQVAGFLGQQNEDVLEQFGKLSTAYATTKDPSIARQWAQLGVQAGMLPPEAAQKDFTNPADLEGSTRAAQAFAQAFGQASAVPAGYQEFDMLAQDANLSPEDRALAARRQLYLDPRPSNAAIKYMEVMGADGRTRIVAVDPRGVGAQVVGTGQTFGTGVMGQDEMFAGLEGIPGVQVTSGFRTPEHNARVGGVPDSFHPRNMARDIAPPQSQEQAQAVMQWASQNGMEVINEGDHWHLEPAPGAQGANPFVGRRPEDEAAATRFAEGSVDLQLAPAQAQAEAERTRAVESAKAGVEREANAPKRTAKARFEIDRATRVESAIDRALGQADWNATGLVGGVLSGLPGTDAFNLARTVDEIKANIGFREIQTMRDNSPTGGALGQVAIQELQMLQATLGSLDQAQDGEQLRATLQRIKESMARWRQLQEAIANEGSPESAPASNDIDSLLGKYGIR